MGHGTPPRTRRSATPGRSCSCRSRCSADRTSSRRSRSIVLLNVLVLMPVALLATYGIGVRIGGRLFGYWVRAPLDPRPARRDQVRGRRLPPALHRAPAAAVARPDGHVRLPLDGDRRRRGVLRPARGPGRRPLGRGDGRRARRRSRSGSSRRTPRSSSAWASRCSPAGAGVAIGVRRRPASRRASSRSRSGRPAARAISRCSGTARRARTCSCAHAAPVVAVSTARVHPPELELLLAAARQHPRALLERASRRVARARRHGRTVSPLAAGRAPLRRVALHDDLREVDVAGPRHRRRLRPPAPDDLDDPGGARVIAGVAPPRSAPPAEAARRPEPRAWAYAPRAHRPHDGAPDRSSPPFRSGSPPGFRCCRRRHDLVLHAERRESLGTVLGRRRLASRASPCRAEQSASPGHASARSVAPWATSSSAPRRRSRSSATSPAAARNAASTSRPSPPSTARATSTTPRSGRWVYRIAAVASWIHDPTTGNIFVAGPPVTVKVPK